MGLCQSVETVVIHSDLPQASSDLVKTSSLVRQIQIGFLVLRDWVQRQDNKNTLKFPCIDVVDMWFRDRDVLFSFHRFGRRVVQRP